MLLEARVNITDLYKARESLRVFFSSFLRKGREGRVQSKDCNVCMFSLR